MFGFLGRLLMFLIVVGGIGAGLSWYYLNTQMDAASGQLEEKTVVIDRGSSLSAIGARLKEAGVIPDDFIFTTGVRVLGDPAKLQAGEYAFPPNSTPRQVMDLLASGKVLARSFTLVEGWTVRRAVEEIAALPGLEGAVTVMPDEGTLLPETYNYTAGETRDELIKRMSAAMDKTLLELWEGRALGLPLNSAYEALVLASIVEKETGIDGERAKVAAVFINRLNKGMRLQSDPTVIYGITKGQEELDRALLTKDVQQPSAYNTYTLDRLPPGPIANPGRAAIEAVLHPATTNDLYFVADGTGGHVFAETLEGHNANVANWRQVQRERRMQPPVPAPTVPALPTPSPSPAVSP